jgi:hypothetical protein
LQNERNLLIHAASLPVHPEHAGAHLQVATVHRKCMYSLLSLRRRLENRGRGNPSFCSLNICIMVLHQAACLLYQSTTLIFQLYLFLYNSHFVS